MRYRCHQCFGECEVEEIAHRDIFSDLCWIQCDTCAAAFGPACGLDRVANPKRHGYLTCPFATFVWDAGRTDGLSAHVGAS